MSHTPEPWKVEYNIAEFNDGNREHSIFARDHEIAVLHKTDGLQTKERTANANRIIACVNACMGLNPKAYRECVEACQAVVSKWENALKERPSLSLLASQCKQALAHATQLDTV